MPRVIQWLNALRRRNRPLYAFGACCWIGALISIILIWTVHTEVAGVPAAVKPFKFFLSFAIVTWTLGWITAHLQRTRAVRHYTWATIITLSIELIIITGQAMRGRMSHFNIATLLDAILFQIMGASITVFTVWTAIITSHLFRQDERSMPAAYLWGIRLGLCCFTLFALEGGIMAAILRHNIGGEDGGAGLPLLTWSRQHGDLRIAHFFGLHSLQVLPVAGYFLKEKKRMLFLCSAIYISGVVTLLIMALNGRPFL